MDLPYEIYGSLFSVALIAGFVDSICGGGGLIVLPTLLLTGFLPAEAFATNKLQGFFGKLSAVLYYRRLGVLSVSTMKLPLLASFIAAALGAFAIQSIQPEILMKLTPWLIGAVAVYFIFSPRIGDIDQHQRICIIVFALTVAIFLGFYDGFWGPGSGSLFALSFVFFLGYNLSKATAHTRLLLLATNLASLGVFISGGNVVWRVGLCMAVGQWIGAKFGSRAVILKGAKLVRPMLVSVCLLLIFKMVFSGD